MKNLIKKTVIIIGTEIIFPVVITAVLNAVKKKMEQYRNDAATEVEADDVVDICTE